MEPAGDTFLESTILWLAQTILANLLLDKLDEWLRRVGLADDTEKLKSQIEEADALVASVKGRAAGNRLLARSLAHLKELLYDSDDLVDELDYCRLQHQVEGVPTACANDLEGADGDAAEQADGSGDDADIEIGSIGKRRSKVWDGFDVKMDDNGKIQEAACKCCRKVLQCRTVNGTSVLYNHLKSASCKRRREGIEQMPNASSSSVGDGAQNEATLLIHDPNSRKRMRIGEVPGVAPPNMAVNTRPWNKAKFSNRIQQITHQLQKAISDVHKLYGSCSVASSNLCQNTAADPCRRTSSLVQRKMYGRVAEKDSIIKSVTREKSDDVSIIPIVGIGGIGKTALAQFVYNDPVVKSQFDHRMWIWVSSNFDEVRLTLEMLEFVSQDKCVGISSLAKLQEILVAHVTSSRTLVVLDDVWDDIDDCRWNKLLAPLRSDNVKGNVIIMTTRKLSIAKRICTVEPVKLGHLQNDDFWLLFKTCAFGDGNYKEHPSLIIIGQQIAKNLHGNPLAAQTAGMLLKEHLTTDHWNNILKNEKWKSLQLNGGIMHALKLSYDELPFYLQQCLLYCSLFPNDHQFLSNELVYIWIAQGFVKCSRSTERLEEVGQRYLTDLLNLGYFEQVETKDPTLGDKILYVMPALMHDFARLVSGTECAAIDDLACREVLPSIRHLSILTYSAYQEDKYGNILRNEKFEGKLQRVVNSTRKLRTLVLIGKYDYYFLQSLQGIFQKAQNLRALKISEAYVDFGYSACNLVNSTHVRYLKLKTKEDNEALPEALSKFYHLQVLDIGSDRYSNVPNGMNNLISLRHLVASKAVYSSIRNIGKMISLQELHDFKVENGTSFEITQLQTMSELAQLDILQLENVMTREEAHGAKLREKRHLEKLQLSWDYALSQHGYVNSMSSEPSSEVAEMGTSKEVLEGLEPHHNLKHLQISGYRSGTSPDWLVSTVSVTCLQTLHLEDCRELQVLPSLERLPLLTKLKLRNMWKLTQITVPSLGELVLIQIPNLEKCSCNSVRDLNSSLRVLVIEGCHALEAFTLFESCEKFRIEQKSWLSGLSKLAIHDCPELIVSNPLPPSSRTCNFSISKVSTFPTMEGSSDGELIIGAYKEEVFHDKDSDGLTELDDKILAFHNLRALTSFKIAGCDNLVSISLEGLRKLISLKILRIRDCKNLFPSIVLPEDSYEGVAPANYGALPYLKCLSIRRSGIAGRWLSLLLRHAPALEDLSLSYCWQITGLLVEEEESNLPNLSSAPEASSSGTVDEASSSRDGLLCIPSNLISSLKKMCLKECRELTFQGNKKGFSEFTLLEELTIFNCPEMISENFDHAFNGRLLLPQSLVKLDITAAPETLQLCFPGHLTCLKELIVWSCPCLESLQLHHCTALEELEISDCESLTEVEGLPSVGCIKSLKLRAWPDLIPWLERLLSEGYDMRPRLVELAVDEWSILTTSWCMHLTSLERLEFMFHEKVTSLTDEQERALQLLTSLQELMFNYCHYLEELPAGLYSLPSLKRLEVDNCWRISRLPEMGLPPSLEELEISDCSEELMEQCRKLATTKLKVKIDRKYVN